MTEHGETTALPASQRFAVITGGAQGLGFAMAEVLLHRGWHVTLIDKDAEQLVKAVAVLQKQCCAANQWVHAVALDILDAEAVQQWLSEPFVCDLFVNNAGSTHRSPASSTQMHVFEQVMNLNWHAPVALTQALLPRLRERQGGVIVVGSMAGWVPLPGRAAYSASKAAVSQHFEVWRPELKRQHIHLLMAYPSFLSTQIEHNALAGNGELAQHKRTTLGTIQSSESMAQHIIEGFLAQKTRVWGAQLSARFGYYLWWLLPDVFRWLSWRSFKDDIPDEY
jgi:short-subunit dehydrogenase